MARPGTPPSLVVGVTNARLGADKRGIAVELAQRLACTSLAPVCLVGADPTDRDVERRTPGLVESAGEYTNSQITQGPHALDITLMPELRVCTVSVSDRTVLSRVLPDLRDRFHCIVVDAPSRVGYGVGIAHGLLHDLDGLLIATGARAGEIAVTRHYLAALEQNPIARSVDVRVALSGEAEESGLSAQQLEERLVLLPVIGWVPHLWGRTATEPARLDEAFPPIVGWVRKLHDELTAASTAESSAPARDDAARKALQAARAAAVYRN